MSTVHHRVDSRDMNGSHRRTRKPWQRQTGTGGPSFFCEITVIFFVIYFTTTIFQFTNGRKNLNRFTILEENQNFLMSHNYHLSTSKQISNSNSNHNFFFFFFRRGNFFFGQSKMMESVQRKKGQFWI